MGYGAHSKTEKVAQTHDLIYTSYHEAGHVIYGLLHLIKIECVYVYFDKESQSYGGYTHYNFLDADNFLSKDIRQFIINSEISIKYAGLTAERYQFKTNCGSDKLPLFIKEGSSNDTKAAADLFRQRNIVVAGKKRSIYKKKLIQHTLDKLQNYWSDVALIAHNLFKYKKIYYSDLKKILLTKSNNKIFWRAQFKTIDFIYKNNERLDEKDFRFILGARGLL